MIVKDVRFAVWRGACANQTPLVSYCTFGAITSVEYVQ